MKAAVNASLIALLLCLFIPQTQVAHLLAYKSLLPPPAVSASPIHGNPFDIMLSHNLGSAMGWRQRLAIAMQILFLFKFDVVTLANGL